VLTLLIFALSLIGLHVEQHETQVPDLYSSSLATGTTYEWSVQVQDADVNTAQQNTTYIPWSALSNRRNEGRSGSPDAPRFFVGWPLPSKSGRDSSD